MLRDYTASDGGLSNSSGNNFLHRQTSSSGSSGGTTLSTSREQDVVESSQHGMGRTTLRMITRNDSYDDLLGAASYELTNLEKNTKILKNILDLLREDVDVKEALCLSMKLDTVAYSEEAKDMCENVRRQQLKIAELDNYIETTTTRLNLLNSLLAKHVANTCSQEKKEK